MNTLLLTRDFPPEGGGIARALGELARHADPARFAVSTGSVPDAEGWDAACPVPVDRVGVPVERLRTLTGLLRWGWRADRLARRQRPAFLWAGNVKPAGHVARWLGRRRGIPYGLVVYGHDLERLARQAAADPVKHRRAAELLWEAAGTVAISHWTARRFTALAAELGVERAGARVRVVPLGVDAHRFHPGAADAGVRARLGLDQRPWLLTVARLKWHKGIDTALRVVQALAAAGLDVGYAVAGEGPDAEALRARAARMDLADRVRWLGRVPEADLPALYASATVYLGLSRQEGEEVEGFGLSLLEAQASGVPVVAGRSGGTEDAVHHGVTGFLTDPRSDLAARPLVEALLRDPSRAGVLGAAGRARMLREFTWERVAADLAAAAGEFSRGWAGPAGR